MLFFFDSKYKTYIARAVFHPNNIRMSREFYHHVWRQVNPRVSWNTVQNDWHRARICYLGMNE